MRPVIEVSAQNSFHCFRIVGFVMGWISGPEKPA